MYHGPGMPVPLPAPPATVTGPFTTVARSGPRLLANVALGAIASTAALAMSMRTCGHEPPAHVVVTVAASAR